MNTITFKDRILKQLESINDEAVLNLIASIIDIENDQAMLNLSEDQMRAIDQGLNEIKSGSFISQEDLIKETAQWLKK